MLYCFFCFYVIQIGIVLTLYTFTEKLIAILNYSILLLRKDIIKFVHLQFSDQKNIDIGMTFNRTTS